MGKIAEIVQALIKVFVRSNKRFPQGQEIKEIQSQARQVLDGALTHNLDQAKGKNLDDIDVMEKTMDKNADQLIDDYLSNEEIKGRMTSEPPTFTQVDQRKLPRAEIEALPLKDKEKAEAAVKKKLEAQNVQARQSREGGETPGGPQRGRPEVVDKSFGKTVYVDKSEMEERMNQAYRQFEAAEDALSAGNTDEARGILRYEIEENYKFPKNVRDAAADARYMIIRGEGIDTRDFENLEEATQELREKIQFGKNQTAPDNYPDITDPLEGEPQNVEYVSFFDEPGEDFGTPNSVITDIDKLDFKEGGRVGMAAGGIMRLINKLVKTKKMGADRAADLVDLIEQAKKAGIPIKTMNDLENFEKQIREAGGKVYESRKKYPGVPEGEKSGLPVILKGKAPKTNLKKIRQKIYKDRQDLLELAKNEQIPVKQIDDFLSGKIKKVKRSAGRGVIEMDDAGVPYVTETFSDKYGTAWIRAEKARLKGLIKVLQTPMLKNDRIDDLKVLEKVEELGGDKAMYDDLRMRKYKNLPSKSEYRFDPEEAERKASTQISKTKKEVDQLLDIKDDDPNMFDDIFNKMFQEYQDTKPLPGEKPLTKKKRKLNAEGGLNYLLGL